MKAQEDYKIDDIVLIDFTEIRIINRKFQARVINTTPNPYHPDSMFVDYIDLETNEQKVCDSFYIKEIISSPSNTYGIEGNQRIGNEY